MSHKDLLRDSWASLGVAFNNSSQTPYSPEDAILSLVTSGEFPEDKKILGLAISWLKNHSRLVHVERLLNLSKDLRPQELAILGAIASKCVADGDHRWKKIEQLSLKTVRKKGNTFVFQGDDELLLKMRGIDPEFAKFKIYVSPIEPQSEKKFLVWNKTVNDNPWIRFRLLFGSNLRADVATVLYLGLADTAYAAAKYLHCSQSAVYRNWNDLHEAKLAELFPQMAS